MTISKKDAEILLQIGVLRGDVLDKNAVLYYQIQEAKNQLKEHKKVVADLENLITELERKRTAKSDNLRKERNNGHYF